MSGSGRSRGGSPSCVRSPIGRERELDLLAFELEEIERVSPSEAEAGELDGERERLRHLETLRGSAFAGAEAIAPDGGVGGAAELLAGAAAQLQAAAGIDPRLDELSERIVSLGYEAQDVGAALRSYADGLEGSPGRLEEVEERLGRVRPARAQARRVGRRGACPCGALPAPARGARAGRGLARLLPVRAGRGARGDGRCGARSCSSGASERRRSSPRPCAGGWPSWPCPTLRSRSSWRAGRAGAGRGERMPSS